MKKIAFIMDAGKRTFIYSRLVGLLNRIKQAEEEISLYIFRSAGAWNLGSDYNAGEYNIYRLPDFSDFDGIILDLNCLYQRDKYGCGVKACEAVVQAAIKSEKPVISLANRIDGCYFVGIDNYNSMRSIIAHVYEIHQCRKYWFIMGPNDNYENRLREKAIRDYLQEHHAYCGSELFYNESYECSCGIHGFYELWSRFGNLPDAVICANDNIAAGVAIAAEKYSFSVPGDFILTGFDNFDKAAYFSPRITTVDQKQEQVGYECINLFLRIWQENQVQERVFYTKTETIFWDSCGCKAPATDYEQHSKQQIVDAIERSEYEEMMKRLEYGLLRCQSVEQMCNMILQEIQLPDNAQVYLVLDKNIADFKNEVDIFQGNSNYSARREKFCVNGYPDIMDVICIKRANGRAYLEKDEITSLFPFFESKQAGSSYLFIPLHFGEYTAGYLVMMNAMYLLEKQEIDKLAGIIMMAMEHLHKSEKLEYINEELTAHSLKDAMTGLYNRFGYQQVACRMFEEYQQKKEELTIMFLDMDRLKYMNDTYGHECGDCAIKTVAEAIVHHCPENAVPVRMGGDEFLIVMEKMTTEQASLIESDIRGEISMCAREEKMPCALTVSIGCVDTDNSSGRTLDDYVRDADAVMYVEKTAGKKNRPL